MKVLDAIETVLKDAGAPLHYEAITKQILEKGLWTAGGKTPEATVNAALAVAHARDQNVPLDWLHPARTVEPPGDQAEPEAPVRQQRAGGRLLHRDL